MSLEPSRCAYTDELELACMRRQSVEIQLTDSTRCQGVAVDLQARADVGEILFIESGHQPDGKKIVELALSSIEFIDLFNGEEKLNRIMIHETK